MSRPKSPPRLTLRRDRDGIRRWVIKDGAKYQRTGCVEAEAGKAERQLADHIAGKYQPAGKTDAHSLTVGDILAAYVDKVEAKVAKRKDFLSRVGFLNAFLGSDLVSSINGERCRAYAAHRSRQRNQSERERIAKARAKPGRAKPAPWQDKDFTSASRRELEDLRSAINFYAKEYGLDPKPAVTLPEKPVERERWLTRQEAAAMLRAALRLRRKHPQYAHLCRFIVTGLYTAGRHRSILQLNWNAGIHGGWPDLDKGVLYRKGQRARETKKRRPPARMPSRLLAHLRRWKRLDRGRGPIVHGSLGEPIKRIEKAFRTCRTEAGLGTDVIPHVLRHTRTTWLMQRGVDIWQVAGNVGMTVEQLEKTYGHHHPDFQKDAAEAY